MKRLHYVAARDTGPRLRLQHSHRICISGLIQNVLFSLIVVASLIFICNGFH